MLLALAEVLLHEVHISNSLTECYLLWPKCCCTRSTFRIALLNVTCFGRSFDYQTLVKLTTPIFDICYYFGGVFPHHMNDGWNFISLHKSFVHIFSTCLYMICVLFRTGSMRTLQYIWYESHSARTVCGRCSIYDMCLIPHGQYADAAVYMYTVPHGQYAD